jgi:DNA helicase-2/ATP-dependent DNA helicase PcrA
LISQSRGLGDVYKRQALYRLAYSRFSGLPLEKIEASFYFVAENVEIKPVKMLTEVELIDLWKSTIAN